jgi:SynChlorMet cassette protein ScmC
MYNENNHSGCYHIQLDDKACWNMQTTSVMLQPWLEKLATIMGLDDAAVKNGTKHISFINSDYSRSGHPYLLEEPNNGWSRHDLSSLFVWDHDGIPGVICKIKPFDSPDLETIAMWDALYPIYRESISRGGLPFHAGLVELAGRGVILAGPGDTGKSTCCSRLPHYWSALCDDEVLVVLDNEGNFRAHPFPTWSDYLWRGSEKTWNVQRSVPIFGVFFIEQSQDDEAIPLGQGKAAVYMNESATQVCRKYWKRAGDEYQRTFRRNLFVNTCEMAKQIPAFRLRVSLHGRFWEEIERVLGW